MNGIIAEKLKMLPERPGVYVMRDESDVVIYVGKARVLKNRVRQYFQNNVKSEKVAAMVARIADFSYIITATEIDALALENNLIKKYKPKYNILLKDDKTYPYIKAHTNEKFPRFSVTRKITKEGKYFGPFMGGIRCKDVLDILSLVYNVRTCAVSIGEKPKKPCLAAHLGRCLAPCARVCEGKEFEKTYAAAVKRALAFLDGDLDEAEAVLNEKMRKFADEEEFEIAMDYREKAKMIEKLKLKRITSLNRFIDADVVAYKTNRLYSAVSLLITRKGVMQGGSNFALEEAYESDGAAVAAFISRYYETHELPQEIVAENVENAALLEEYFEKTQGKKVKIVSPKQGVKRALLNMAEKNAEDFLLKSVDKIKHKDDMTTAACERLQQLLSLSRYPRRIECYDISNISGVDKVGSMAVFVNGEAEKTAYRRFRIKTVEGANDFASLQEVLRRRLAKLSTSEEEKFPKPDLIVIDGGKGQLSAVKEIFDETHTEGIDLVSLAKREEEVFTLTQSESVVIDRRDYALKMLQRLRDEAHRFAITYFRTLHDKRNLTSRFSEIEGVGKEKRKALLNEFKTVENIAQASEESLARVPGIGEKLARNIKKYFEENF
ncbi:MAG: excinuclease ABC subunit UvrC [Candidatus Borkfalkiaceae bacterium]|nr:excinuclease ABC subunit UvrC [Clostridia bacterium]MDY6222863.1 excinuclease ABC subunit UvrC [Christensenellaceae bacterium]